MLRLRFTTDCQPRTSSGHPAHSTAGVASASSSQPLRPDVASGSKGRPGMSSLMPSASTGTASATATQKRRRMSASSGFSCSSRATVRGSSAMPQIGQLPGATRTISGCIGHTHSTRSVGAAGSMGSSAMPHLGQAPGPCWRTSGSIGQV
ncbi:MAG: hypothetical protein A2V63_09215 [Candidatus Eisenbacteria bacterium RBG_19FT_COMBO_70_11]|nr:MAG: hypothetical protein A2V63_09215 [Candidatus Eisenbacteria bacterium RBG_19FT_COMBO_70_11]